MKKYAFVLWLTRVFEQLPKLLIMPKHVIIRMFDSSKIQIYGNLEIEEWKY